MGDAAVSGPAQQDDLSSASGAAERAQRGLRPLRGGCPSPAPPPRFRAGLVHPRGHVQDRRTDARSRDGGLPRGPALRGGSVDRDRRPDVLRAVRRAADRQGADLRWALQHAGAQAPVRGESDGLSRVLPLERAAAGFAQAQAALASLSARLRSCALRKRLRIRIDRGVTSTSSSSAMNSTAYSSVSLTGGVSSTLSSLPAARMLVSFFSLSGLTVRSLSRLWMPTTMPS